MKRSAGITLGFFLIAVSAFADNESVPFDSDRWEIEAEEWRIEEHLGQPSLFLKGGVAVIKDAAFTDGILEFDIAFPEDRNFVGAMWRFQGEENFEDFYMRPHQSGNPDATQYTPVFNGLSGWQLYHGEGYAAPVEYRFEDWIHVKIVISGSQGEIYIGEGDEPAPAGTVMSWSVSSTFAGGDLEGKHDLADSQTEGLSWKVLDCESTGLGRR